MLPFSLVDKMQSCIQREFVGFLELDYQVPCRQSFSNRFDKMKTALTEAVTTEISSVPTVSVTTDIWTSFRNNPHISFTVSYLTSDWKLICRTIANEPMERRLTQANVAQKTNWT
jgi:hypothetical protein